MKDLTERQQKLKRIRESWGMTQKQFAEVIGMSTRSIEDYDRGINEVPVAVDRLIDFIAKEREAQSNAS